MVFASPVFLCFFLPLVLLAYFCSSARWKNAVLLIASLIYYAWGEGVYCLLLILPITVTWLASLQLQSTERADMRKRILIGAIAVDLAALVYFKYANFLAANVNTAMGATFPGFDPFPNTPIHLPLGISFFTFHALSYLIDVYRRATPAQPSMANFALYMAFFPQLVAGPIVRYRDIAAQLTARAVDIEKFASGIERFVIGLGKKVLIANSLGATADRVFALTSGELSTPAAWLGIICYAFQIYFDFSGYSDMAIGLARMFGFSFLENFNYPYVATSMRDFWRRWHISLSNWFRDYVYIPLGGNRYGMGRTYANLLIVFLLCGLWHGANWTFLIWGLIHGAFLAIERGPFGTLLSRAWSPLRHAYTLLIVLIAWVFFRADTVSHAWDFLSVMFGRTTAPDPLLLPSLLDSKTAALLVLAAIAATPVFSNIPRDWAVRARQSAVAIQPLRALVVLIMFALSAIYLAGQAYNPFIYFRF